MNDYKAGTVAKATVRGVPDVTVFRYREGRACRWDSAERVEGSIVHSDSDVTDVRPLVVLDLTPAYGCWTQEGNPSIIVNALRETNLVAAHAIADQIEAQTKPPRIPEPTGRNALVRDRDGLVWARGAEGWTNLNAKGPHLNWKSWYDADDPIDAAEIIFGGTA